MTTIRIVLAIAAVLLASAPAVNTQSAASAIVIRAARMFDSATGRVTGPATIVVSGGKIQSVGAPSAPAGATVIDLGDATLLPGFIDAHTHLGYEFNPDFNGATLDGFRMTVPEVAIRATANARKTLMAGFTTVRDLGASDFVDVGLRITRVFGDRARRLPTTSIKSMVGHCLAAAGAVEAAALAMSIHSGVVPPTVNYRERDPECDLDIVATGARERPIACGISTSLAFGGNDAAIVMKKF